MNLNYVIKYKLQYSLHSAVDILKIFENVENKYIENNMLQPVFKYRFSVYNKYW